MKLSELILDDFFVPPEWDREFNAIATDSRDVSRGDLFIARSGSVAHGAEFIAAAIQAGAAVVVAQGEAGFRCEWIGASSVPVFTAPNVNELLPHWLHRCYQKVAGLPVLGVTGTNGKSSCVSYMAQLSTAVQKPCAVLGTLGNGVWPQLQATRNTTPDLSVVLRTLDEAVVAGAERAAMEVSSHGLDQGRVSGLKFAGVMMTNLTQDHLDYHGTMAAYFDAKKALLKDYGAASVVVNIDCPYGRSLMSADDLSAAPIGYGSIEAAADLPAGSKFVSYRISEFSVAGMIAELVGPWGTAELKLPLLGEFNLANAVGSITLLASCGENFQQLVTAAAGLQPVSGRMEIFNKPVPSPLAVVDYAHTPDAIETVLNALKPWQRPLTIVFGCGGDRDRSKRPKMLAAAMQYANRIVVTSDNPRSEAPEAIIADILSAAGAESARQAGTLQVEVDREKAIRQVMAEAGADEIIVLAGKGHEDYQEVNGERRPYSDIAVLKSLGYNNRETGDAV